MYEVNVIDSICGSGKTTAMINYINTSPSSKKFLYITPFLTEVDRIKQSCPSKNFQDPKFFGSKMNGLKYLISRGENIVSTHALFRLFDEETIDLTCLNDYTLILDEVADVVDFVSITSDDIETLLEKYTECQEEKLLWTAKKYRGEFEKYKRLCEMGCVNIFNPKNQTPILLWLFPISIFKAFKDIYILTYLFDAQMQKYYYDYHGIKYNNLYVKDDLLTNEIQVDDIKKYKDLVRICHHEKLNSIGELEGSFSKSWFDRNERNQVMRTLRNNCINYFKHISNTPSKANMWTTFKEFRNSAKGDGYSRGFVHLNIRATNEYIHKQSIAYLANRYMNPFIKNFFISNGVKIDEDMFALSEILQFMFRSQIRVDKPVDIYVPSKRMRNILTNWIETP